MRLVGVEKGLEGDALDGLRTPELLLHQASQFVDCGTSSELSKLVGNELDKRPIAARVRGPSMGGDEELRSKERED